MISRDNPWFPILEQRRNHYMQEYRWLEKLRDRAPEGVAEHLESWQRAVMKAIRALEGVTGLGPWDGG